MSIYPSEPAPLLTIDGHLIIFKPPKWTPLNEIPRWMPGTWYDVGERIMGWHNRVMWCQNSGFSGYGISGGPYSGGNEPHWPEMQSCTTVDNNLVWCCEGFPYPPAVPFTNVNKFGTNPCGEVFLNLNVSEYLVEAPAKAQVEKEEVTAWDLDLIEEREV